MRFFSKSLTCLLLFLLLLSVGSFQAVAADKLDVNSATVEQLVEIKGVGDVIARRIVDYRQQHNGFTSLAELSEVKGIGDKKLEQMTPYLTLVKAK
ncbi:competence protein ComEA [Malonomonas rubra DSM 5091]|uniref:Competence protein ComEA n=1 Tax=Malonomonas rubra DSM 5091 TaxID=1122189 RepID=A0A1M6DTA6_MALRU|nr:helix-hairpin-helix domain-containing protein [Malonomonas rubra]SHI76360.1 competence protein ComEA [Malonomonas rubra DSM 5091]